MTNTCGIENAEIINSLVTTFVNCIFYSVHRYTLINFDKSTLVRVLFVVKLIITCGQHLLGMAFLDWLLSNREVSDLSLKHCSQYTG